MRVNAFKPPRPLPFCALNGITHVVFCWLNLKQFNSNLDTVSKKNRSKPPNLSSMLDVADRMSHSTSVRFTYGVAYQLNEYTADGTIFDFMAGKRKVSWLSKKLQNN